MSKTNYHEETYSTPPADVELRAMGFGLSVEKDSDEIVLGQMVDFDGVKIIVQSYLTSDDLRQFADQAVRAADVADTPHDQRTIAPQRPFPPNG